MNGIFDVVDVDMEISEARNKFNTTKQEYDQYMNGEKGKFENFALEPYLASKIKQAEKNLQLKLKKHNRIKFGHIGSVFGIPISVYHPYDR